MNNHQQGPPADTLAEVVAHTTYKPGWKLWLADQQRETEHLAGSQGLTLCISAVVKDSTTDGNTTVEHWFIPPTASYDSETWQRWVLDCLIKVETHEAMEFFKVDGNAVFFPAHGVGRDPYTIERRLKP